MATTTFMAHNVVGRKREDYIQVVMAAAETTAIIPTRLKRVDAVAVQQDGHGSPDNNVNFTLNTPGVGPLVISGATAEHTYRIRVTGR
jgi:hypothetical protein